MNKTQDTPSKSIHAGHRKRMRARFSVHGGKDFADHELLELLLCYAIPRANTNDLAHRLLNEFGSLGGVLCASEDRITSVDGAGESVAILVNLCNEINRRSGEATDTSRKHLDTISKAGGFFVNQFKGESEEIFYAALLDSSMKLIELATLSTGSVNSAPFDVRALAKRALRKDATCVILAHNHPSGSALPSVDDHKVTMHAESALSAIGVTLIEHIIVSGDVYTPSMMSRSSNTASSSRFKGGYGFYTGFYELKM